MTEYNWDEVCELRERLQEYAGFEYTSHSEAMEALCALSQYPDYITQELYDAVVAGMKYELQNYIDNAKIITTTETFTKEVVDLVWER